MVPVNGRRPLLLLLAALSVALAGCANNASDPDDGGVSPPPQTSPEEARGLLTQATGDVPEQVSARGSVSKGSRVLLAMNGTFDNATRTSYVEVGGDAQALSSLAGPGGAAFAGILQGGFTLYSSPQGSLYLVNGTALAFPPGNDTGRSSVGVPSPSESPFGAFLEPRQVLGALTEANVTVKSVESVVYREKPALRITLSRAEEGTTMESVVTLFTDPVRIARVEGVAPRDAANAADPFAGATFVVDFYYDGEVDIEVPEAATRAVGLSYTSDQPPLGGDPNAPATWTLQSSVGIPLDEVEAQVKDTRNASPSDVTGVSRLPTLWSMKLSEGNKTQDGATLTFTDVDGDGKVSKGDTLRFEGGQGARVVLYDTKTGTYVIPSAGLVLALAGLGVAALLLRRR